MPEKIEVKFQAQSIILKPNKTEHCWRLELDVPEIEYGNVSILGGEAFTDSVYEVVIKKINNPEENG